MRIAVIGASGWLGGAIAREALARGHEVTAMGRKRGRLEAIEGATTGIGYEVRGDDRPVVDATGESAITSGDLAAAIVDELEAPQFARRRFTAAYAL
jgi:putative NADH-flavin reductase